MRKIILLSSLVFCLLSWKANSDFIVYGKILDTDTKDPLFAVNIVEKGTSNGVVSDLDGKFQLKLTKKCVELEVSYIAYKTQTIKVCAGERITVEMTPEQAQLEEVIIQAESSRRKERKPKPYKAKALKGKVAGVQLKKQANSAPIIVRGQATLYNQGYDSDDESTSGENYSTINENRFLKTSDQLLSTFSIDVDAASYSNMRRYVNTGVLPPKDAVRIEEMINYFDYDYPQPKKEVPFSINTEVSECPWATNHKLVHIGLQGKKIENENLPASNIVFLLDVSGSMNSANKLPLLRSSFKLLTDQLRAQDRVAIVVYAGAAGLVLPSTSGSNKQKIKAALDQLSAGGSTAGGAGIKLAYNIARKYFVQGGNNRVILATDGDFNIGASSDEEMVKLIEKERESGIFLTVLGFGTGNYKDSKMQQLADKGNGNHAYIDSELEAKKVLVKEFGGTLFTIAKDVKIQVAFNPAQVQGYRLIGYENRLLENRDFEDDTKDAGELGSGHTVTALYEVIPTGVPTDLLSDTTAIIDTSGQSNITFGNEMISLKLRYKHPEGAVSKEIVHEVKGKNTSAKATSDNFRWSAAVASFGLTLRDSDFKGTSNYKKALELARIAQGKDPNGYRKEFIELIEKTKELSEKLLAIGWKKIKYIGVVWRRHQSI